MRLPANKSFDADTHRHSAAKRAGERTPRAAMPVRAGQLRRYAMATKHVVPTQPTRSDSACFVRQTWCVVRLAPACFHSWGVVRRARAGVHGSGIPTRTGVRAPHNRVLKRDARTGRATSVMRRRGRALARR